jgi:hypothetical protein
MTKKSKLSVTPEEFMNKFMREFGIDDPRNVSTALDNMMKIMALQKSVIENMGLITLAVAPGGLFDFTISPHITQSPEYIETAFLAIDQLKESLTELVKPKESVEDVSVE